MVVSVPHRRIKFLTPTGVNTMASNPSSMYDYLMRKRKLTLEHEGNTSTEVKVIGECSNTNKPQKSEYVDIVVNPIHPEQTINVGLDLFEEARQELCDPCQS